MFSPTGCYCCKTLCLDNHRLGIISRYNSKLDSKVISRTLDPALLGTSPTLGYLKVRNFHIVSTWRGQEPSSKVEETVKSLKEDKEEKEKMTVAIPTALAQSTEKAVVKKPTIWQRVKGEMLHYYHGFRLLGLDMKIAAKLAWRLMKGKELTRREHRLVNKFFFF